MTVINWLGAIALLLGAFLMACGSWWVGALSIAAGAIVAGTDWQRV